jgi:TolA-binding protein
MKAQLAQQAQQARLAQKRRASAANRRLEPLSPTPSSAPAPVPVLATPLAASSESLPRPVPVPAGPGRKLAVSDEPLSSSELFTRANQARRRGDIEDAISLYERLGRAYPSSVEAEDAKILRGNLLLSQRSPRAALRQFEDYHSGALSLEALWGRAQALRKLESPEERAILTELVRDYPDSPYAEAAKKRLRELAR